MTLDEFITRLASKGLRWALVEGDDIRVAEPGHPCNGMCPLCALAFMEKGILYSNAFFVSAAQVIGLQGDDLGPTIARAADFENEPESQEQEVRNRLLRELSVNLAT